MKLSYVKSLLTVPVSARCVFGRGIVLTLALFAGMMFAARSGTAQQRAADEVTVKQVASDVYFLFDFSGSNAVFLVTEEGVHRAPYAFVSNR